MRIPVVMVSDDNYISQTRVTIWTMRKNTNKEIFMDISILCSEQLEERSRKRLVELESVWPNLKINFYEVDCRIFADAKPAERIPIASFYRLIIPEVLKEDKKCLFLDGDLIVNTDLQNLYMQDIEDVYVAGIRDGDFLFSPETAINHFNTYGFQSFCTYVNAGVMVFNLDKMRRDHVQRQLLDCMRMYYPYMDQDILNKVCDGKIKLLDSKYNYFNRCKSEKVKSKEDYSFAEEKEWEILHFAGAYKPWNDFRIRGGEEWWKYAKEALEKEIYEEMYKRAQKAAMKSDWSYILEHCTKAEVIIILGYSHIGIDVFTSLKRCHIESKIFFCDNSKEKQSLSDENIVIYPVEILAKQYTKALWINTSQYRYMEINEQLRKLGVDERRIIRYRKKDEIYFDMLDDSYIEYELKELQLKSMGSLNEYGDQE